jgi:hypothetical protein
MKPVAWMLNGKLHDCDPSDWAKEQYPDQDVIPLYTAPRELSDEEILELTKDSTIFEYREFDDDMIRFARAILKKASEK